MRKKIVEKCPVCDGDLTITQLSCHSCSTSINGSFELNELNQLSREEVDFVLAFLRVQGNIKQMEKIFNLSYPTIKKNLSAINDKLQNSEIIEDDFNEAEILEKIKTKELTVEEALEIINSGVK